MKKFITGTFGLLLFFTLSFSQTQGQGNKHPNNNGEQLELRRFDSVIVLENKSETSANVSFADLDGDLDLDIVLAKGRHWPLFNKFFSTTEKANFQTP